MRQARALYLAPLGFVGVLVAVRTATTQNLPMPACPVHALTGLDCPGCGTTRAVAALARFDVASAFDHNALLIFVLVVAAAAWARAVRAKPSLFSGHPYAPRTLVVIAAVFTVLRNLPLPYVSFLAAGG